MEMEKEYETLRLEILQWQNRRFDIMAGSIIGTTAILGWIVSTPNNWSWAIAASIPLTFLSCACFLNCLFNRSVAVIGAYLEVFHPGKWNNRIRRFRAEQNKIMIVNTGFMSIYIALGAISIIISGFVCLKTATIFEVSLLAFVSILFIIALLILYKYSTPKESFLERWEKIRSEEIQSQSEIALKSSTDASAKQLSS